MTLPPLPIPTLEETTTRYLTWIRPLLTESEYEQTEKVVDDFINHEGKTLQQSLKDFAKDQQIQGKSWLSDAWLDSYLNVRESLPLSTSGAFRLSLNLPGETLTRLAYLMAGLAKQSADYLNGELADNVSPRGEKLDMRQWLSLQGIGRIPQETSDRYDIAPASKQTRYAIVFWQSQPYALPVLDAQHRLYSVDNILEKLRWITRQSPSDNPISDLSRAPADQAAVLYSELAQIPINKDNFDLLAHSLFHIHLSEQPFASDADALRELTYLTSEKLWGYKPLTICGNLGNNDLYIHLEHGSYDAGALQAILARAESAAQQLDFASSEADMSDEAPQALQWQISDAQLAQLAALQTAFCAKAKPFQARITTVTFDYNILPERTSIDCIMQLIMQYAQLKTYGEIRNTYEAVDVSHFQAGRTECVRPVSMESVAFSQALLNGNATLEDFQLAHQEHKNRIKACKQGHGVNRHLLGLQLMAQKNNLEPAIFNDKGYEILTTDFLSTSTLGDRHVIGDFAFRPTSSNGLGVTYFLTDNNDGFLYCVSYHEDQAADVEKFIAALNEGAHRLAQLFNRSKTENS